MYIHTAKNGKSEICIRMYVYGTYVQVCIVHIFVIFRCFLEVSLEIWHTNRKVHMYVSYVSVSVHSFMNSVRIIKLTYLGYVLMICSLS